MSSDPVLGSSQPQKQTQRVEAHRVPHGDAQRFSAGGADLPAVSRLQPPLLSSWSTMIMDDVHFKGGRERTDSLLPSNKSEINHANAVVAWCEAQQERGQTSTALPDSGNHESQPV